MTPATVLSRRAPWSARFLVSVTLAGATACAPGLRTLCSGSVRGKIDAVAKVTEWALGSGKRSRDDAPPSAYLMIIDVDAQSLAEGTRLSACTPMDMMLPDPFAIATNRTYLASEGRLWVFSLNADPQVRLVGELPPGFVVEQLLGYERGRGPRPQLLVAGRSRSAPDSPEALDYWLLDINDDTIVEARQIRVEQLARSRTEFFSRFALPRCARRDESCLSVSHDGLGSYVDLEARRSGSDRTELMDLAGAPALLDVAWATPAAGMIYLLVDDCTDTTVATRLLAAVERLSKSSD